MTTPQLKQCNNTTRTDTNQYLKGVVVLTIMKRSIVDSAMTRAAGWILQCNQSLPWSWGTGRAVREIAQKWHPDLAMETAALTHFIPLISTVSFSTARNLSSSCSTLPSSSIILYFIAWFCRLNTMISSSSVKDRSMLVLASQQHKSHPDGNMLLPDNSNKMLATSCDVFRPRRHSFLFKRSHTSFYNPRRWSKYSLQSIQYIFEQPSWHKVFSRDDDGPLMPTWHTKLFWSRVVLYPVPQGSKKNLKSDSLEKWLTQPTAQQLTSIVLTLQSPFLKQAHDSFTNHKNCVKSWFHCEKCLYRD